MIFDNILGDILYYNGPYFILYWVIFDNILGNILHYTKWYLIIYWVIFYITLGNILNYSGWYFILYWVIFDNILGDISYLTWWYLIYYIILGADLKISPIQVLCKHSKGAGGLRPCLFAYFRGGGGGSRILNKLSWEWYTRGYKFKVELDWQLRCLRSMRGGHCTLCIIGAIW